MTPDWKPTLDGKAQYYVEGADGVLSFNEPLQNANFTVKAVALPAGDKEAEMTPEERARAQDVYNRTMSERVVVAEQMTPEELVSSKNEVMGNLIEFYQAAGGEVALKIVDQIMAILLREKSAARAEALEEAAKVAETMPWVHPGSQQSIAAAIRAKIKCERDRNMLRAADGAEEGDEGSLYLTNEQRRMAQDERNKNMSRAADALRERAESDSSATPADS